LTPVHLTLMIYEPAIQSPVSSQSFHYSTLAYAIVAFQVLVNNFYASTPFTSTSIIIPLSVSFPTLLLSLVCNAEFLPLRSRTLTGYEHFLLLPLSSCLHRLSYLQHQRYSLIKTFHIAFEHPEVLCTCSNINGRSVLFSDESTGKINANFITDVCNAAVSSIGTSCTFTKDKTRMGPTLSKMPIFFINPNGSILVLSGAHNGRAETSLVVGSMCHRTVGSMCHTIERTDRQGYPNC
jgi:hypothetical protein